jgi:hypothetical protein
MISVSISLEHNTFWIIRRSRNGWNNVFVMHYYSYINILLMFINFEITKTKTISIQLKQIKYN